MGNIMKFLSPTYGVFYIISCHGYHALLVLGKDIPLIYVFKHIFLPVVLFKLTCKLLNRAVVIPCLGKHLGVPSCLV